MFIKEYLEVFSRDQIHVVRLEDFSDNMKDNLQDIFDFLGLGKSVLSFRILRENIHPISPGP